MQSVSQAEPPRPQSHPCRADYTPTPDRRYFVVRGRLWRLSNPWLDAPTHKSLVVELMAARRALKAAREPAERMTHRLAIDKAKRALGERGEVWWKDGAPDYNRYLAVNTPYAEWFTSPEVQAVRHH